MIRLATPADVPVIFQLITELAAYERAPEAVEATENLLTEALFADNPRVHVHLAEHPTTGGSGAADQPLDVVGFALWFVNFSTWLGRHGIYVEDLYVRPQFRGRGYGKELLATLARLCIERGYGRLEWWVLDWNEPAIAFYRSIGAVAMDEWTVQRISGSALKRLASG